ncbi:hypothetical protein JTB14_029137 [Gonioctena quinquepunctata]|nr:hypothetical protein JTB14_029137 [Gonioctena quinquepunctata]
MTSSPHPDLTSIKDSRLSYFQRIQQLKQHFWLRWPQKYIEELQTRTKWRDIHNVLNPGALILIKDDRAQPLKWLLGRITTLHPGIDGIARMTTINTTQGLLKQEFSKICPIPIEQREDFVVKEK